MTIGLDEQMKRPDGPVESSKGRGILLTALFAALVLVAFLEREEQLDVKTGEVRHDLRFFSHVLSSRVKVTPFSRLARRKNLIRPTDRNWQTLRVRSWYTTQAGYTRMYKLQHQLTSFAYTYEACELEDSREKQAFLHRMIMAMKVGDSGQATRVNEEFHDWCYVFLVPD